jgi:hypothetical protein
LIDPNDPPRGSMYLYDDITPPTLDGSYQMTVSTDISYDSDTQSAPIDRHFDVVGPRFTLDPTLVVNVYPPRNGQGSYQDALPQVVLKRRTLPWERAIGNVGTPPGDSSPQGQVPWLALLLLEDKEYTILENQKLEDVVPRSVFQQLGSPANILCDAVEVDGFLMDEILPSVEELQLLTHVRQVNVEDRELNAGSSDGFFSVVMSNRLPDTGKKCRACLVSLEQRADLVNAIPPAFEYPGTRFGEIVLEASPRPFPRPISTTAARTAEITFGGTPPGTATLGINTIFVRPVARLVLLHSWQFTVAGPGTFRSLMQRLDVGMIGKVKEAGQPALTDTGHLRLPLLDRAGQTEMCWYRGPLVPWELTRDPLGPYHSADQCRRATPETGAEDVSFAAAFEVGRQLAAADARLAQELMRWRRESYRQSARADVIVQIQKAIPLNLPATLAEKLQVALPPLVSVSAATAVVAGAPSVADRFGINAASLTLGMDPQSVSEVWGLASAVEAQAILGGNPGTLGAVVAAPPETARPNETLDQVAADGAALQRLGIARDRLVNNAIVRTTNLPAGGNQ